MARIAGVDLPREKRIEIGLTYFSVLSPCFWSLGLDTTQNRPF